MPYARNVLLLLRMALIAAAIGVWFYCVVDVIRTPNEGARYLPKLAWLVFVVLVPTVGALTWLFIGRPTPIGSRLTAQWSEQRSAPVAPDDSPEYLAKLDDEIKRRRKAEEIRKRGEIDPHTVDEEIERLEHEFQPPPEDAPPDGPEEGGRGPG